MFAELVRVGALVSTGASVKNHTVGGYFCDIVQIFSVVGAKNPKLDVLGNINFRLSRQFRAYARNICHQTVSTQYKFLST